MFRFKLFVKSFLFAVTKLKNPITFWRGIWQSGYGGSIRFKDGLVLNFDSLGALGLMYAITGQQIYGTDVEGKNIIDVGANRGYFGIWAIHKGANNVLAFEPTKNTYKKLLSNIEFCDQSDRITAINKAVESVERRDIKIYYNEGLEDYSLVFADDFKDYEKVSSISFQNAIEYFDSNTNIHILKLNCEGAEYDIILNSPNHVFERVNTIRMEYHNFRISEKTFNVVKLDKRLLDLGFINKREIITAETHGIVHYWKPYKSS